MDIQIIAEDEYYEEHKDPDLSNKVRDIEIKGFNRDEQDNNE